MSFRRWAIEEASSRKTLPRRNCSPESGTSSGLSTTREIRSPSSRSLVHPLPAKSGQAGTWTIRRVGAIRSDQALPSRYGLSNGCTSHVGDGLGFGGPKGTGEFKLQGNGQTLWVWQNRARWTNHPGTSFYIQNIPAGTTKIEVYRWHSWDQPAGTERLEEPISEHSDRRSECLPLHRSAHQRDAYVPGGLGCCPDDFAGAPQRTAHHPGNDPVRGL